MITVWFAKCTSYMNNNYQKEIQKQGICIYKNGDKNKYSKVCLLLIRTSHNR
jgi:hypothetical protein